MIRFACPGCAATYTVADEKANKTGKCPKCESQFVIPDSPGSADPSAQPGTDVFTPPAPPPPPPPPPVPAAGGQPVEIAPCPGCGSRLTVMPEDLGLDVECPTCMKVYVAERPRGGSRNSRALADPPAGGSKTSRSVPEAASGSRNRPSLPDPADAPPPRRRPAQSDDEDDAPPRRRPPTSRYDDDDDPPPRRRSGRSGRGRSGTKTLRRIGVLSTGKMLGAIYFFLILILMIPFGLLGLVGAAGAPRGALDSAPGMVCLIILAPVFYGVGGFIGGVIMAALYNLVASFAGGIEMEFDD